MSYDWANPPGVDNVGTPIAKTVALHKTNTVTAFISLVLCCVLTFLVTHDYDLILVEKANLRADRAETNTNEAKKVAEDLRSEQDELRRKVITLAEQNMKLGLLVSDYKKANGIWAQSFNELHRITNSYEVLVAQCIKDLNH